MEVDMKTTLKLLFAIFCLCLTESAHAFTPAQTDVIIASGDTLVPRTGGSYAVPIIQIEAPIDSLRANDKLNYVLTITPTRAVPANQSLPPQESVQVVQYIDGFSREFQTVQKWASPSRNDIVTYQEYDEMGRKSNTWLPVIAPTDNRGDSIGFDSFSVRANDIYPYEANPYSTIIYEASPLNRVSEQYGAGQDWRTQGKKVKTEYMANFNSSPKRSDIYAYSYLECRHYVASNVVGVNDTLVTITNLGVYPSWQVYATKTTDEDGNVSMEFKTKTGETILTRQVKNYGTLSEETLDTYYIYDDFGNKAAVLPPEASELLYQDGESWDNSASAVLRDYAYLYIYDNRNRCVARRNPGSDWIYYIHDRTDNVIFTQDGNLRKQGKWMFTLQDLLNRPCLTGVCENAFVPFSTSLNEVAVKVTRFALPYTTSSYEGYNISGLSLVSPALLTAKYYDDYSFLGALGFPGSASFGYESAAEADGFGEWYNTSAKDLLTGEKVARLDETGVTSTYDYSVNYYDYRQRTIQSKSTNHLPGGIDKSYHAYTFTGKPTKMRQVQSATGKPTVTEEYAYTYDHQERLLTTTHKLNGGQEVMLVSNEYDELGRLYSNRRNEDAERLLTTRYTYNIRSWTESIYSPLFSLSLYYNEAPYGVSPAYNGNISSMSWRANETKMRQYDFTYDDLSRLTSATYSEPPPPTPTLSNPQPVIIIRIENDSPQTPAYNDGGVRDPVLPEGSLLSDDTGILPETTANGDNRTTTYYPVEETDFVNATPLLDTIPLTSERVKETANELLAEDDAPILSPIGGEGLEAPGGAKSVSASSETTETDSVVSNVFNYSTAYTYNRQGSPIRILRHGQTGTDSFGIIDDLTLTYRGNQLISAEDAAAVPLLSRDISGDFRNDATATVEYTYDANGNRVSDLNQNITEVLYNLLNLPSQITANGKTKRFVYSANGSKLQGITDEMTTDYVGNKVYEKGTLKRILVDGGYIESGVYHFYLTDHLGNNRVVATATGTVVQTNHYYPYGMTFAEGIRISRQPYKFGGKEKESWQDLGSSDFGARIYQPALCEFDSGDPMMEKYYGWSIYGYGIANPMRHIDPDGKDFWDVVNGTLASLAHNTTWGLMPSTSTSNVSNASHYNTGRTIGDLISMAIAVAEIIDGSIKMVGGMLVAITPSGVGIPIGGTATTIGAVETAHGTGTLYTAMKSMASKEGRVSEARGNGNGGGSKSSGGGKNAKHANQKAKDSAEQKYQEAKARYEELKKKSQKTQEEAEEVIRFKNQVKHWENKRNFAGENHSQNAKGNR
jgi:RHS repeat-associated protein